MRSLVVVTGSLLLAGIVLPADAQQRSAPAQSPQPTKPLAVKAPELAPIASRMLNGAVSIRNTGTAAAGASVATVVCQKIVGAGSCADSPALKKYENAAYPNALVVNVPAIQAGQVYTHSLPFWNSLKWDPGTYQFTVTADAGKQVNETNEGNNVGTAQMKK
jgi:hypothetical protein